jgi:DNA-binding XRE family transcriptional regulator
MQGKCRARPQAGASFGARLRAFRVRAGLSQAARAQRAGLGVATLKALELELLISRANG